MKGSIATILVIAAASILSIAAADAGACAQDIAQLQQILRQQEISRPDGFGTAPQSIDAQLEHQPTPQSVERAKKSAQASISAALNHAETLDAEGKATECQSAVATARLMLNP